MPHDITVPFRTPARRAPAALTDGAQCPACLGSRWGVCETCLPDFLPAGYSENPLWRMLADARPRQARHRFRQTTLLERRRAFADLVGITAVADATTVEPAIGRAS